MKVADLIKALEAVPQDAEVFIGLETFDGVTVHEGRINKETGWYGTRRFAFVDSFKKKDKAVMFTRLREYSDGKTDQGWI